MKKTIIILAISMALLIVSLPICFAAELNLTYDGNGNLVTGDGKYREYNSLNQLWKIRNGTSSSGKLVEEYLYHPTEERVLMKRTYNSAGAVVETVYYVDENFVRVVNSSGNFDFTYVYHEGQLVAQKGSNNQTYYIHGDIEGSTSVVTNSSGKAIENTTYSPFGEIISGGNLTRYDYEGQEHDSVVGDYDFNFRKYKAEWGLFTQPDTLIPNIYDPQSLNRYMFERGNPYKNKDESGHDFGFTIFVIAGLVIIIIGVLTIIAVIEYYREGGKWLGRGIDQDIGLESEKEYQDLDERLGYRPGYGPDEDIKIDRSIGEINTETVINIDYKSSFNYYNIMQANSVETNRQQEVTQPPSSGSTYYGSSSRSWVFDKYGGYDSSLGYHDEKRQQSVLYSTPKYSEGYCIAP